MTTAAVNFGTYDPASATPASNTGYVQVACTCTQLVDCVAFTYTLTVGTGGSGSYTQRTMTGASGRTPLKYDLFQDSSYTQPWGASGKSVLYLVNLFGSFQQSFVYGRAPARQAVVPDTYADAPTVTLSF